MKDKVYSELKKIAVDLLKKRSDDNPFFLYSTSLLNLNITSVKKFLSTMGLASEQSRFYYSMKCNPNITIINKVLEQFSGVDVSSEREFDFALKNNIEPKKITISGPAKTKKFLQKALSLGARTIHIDSKEELIDLEALSKATTTASEFTLRVNIDDRSSKLGMKIAEINEILKSSTLNFVGIHFYLGRESFSIEKIINALDKVSLIYNEFFLPNSKPFELFIGPGLNTLLMNPNLTLKHPLLDDSSVKCHFEMGRVLLETTAIYCSFILSAKEAASGKKEIIINGGIQHLSSTLMSFGKKDSVHVESLFETPPKLQNSANIYGSLCLSNDLVFIADNLGDDLKRGDWLLFYPCGAYNISASASDFIMQDKAREYLYSDKVVENISRDKI